MNTTLPLASRRKDGVLLFFYKHKNQYLLRLQNGNKAEVSADHHWEHQDILDGHVLVFVDASRQKKI